MCKRGGGARVAFIAVLLGLWLLPVWAQEQPPELEALHKRGLQLYEAAKFAEAIPIVEEYLAVAAARYGERHPLYATGLGYLADLYQVLNRPSEAEPLFKRALSIKEKTLGPDHLEVADALYDLAEFYRKQGRLSEAEPLFKRVLSAAEKAMGSEHSSIATVLTNLAQLYRVQGRLADAEPLFKRALTIRENTLGPNNVEVAWSLNELSVLYQQQERYEEGGALLARANEIVEKVMGSEHKHLLDQSGKELALRNLEVMALARAGKYDQAIDLAKRQVAAKEAQHGTEHTSYAASLNNLASLYQSAGRYGEAEPLMRRALAIDEKSLGPEHPTVAIRLNNLASLLQDTNRLAEAEPLYRRALTIDEKSLGPDHPAVAVRLNNLGGLLRNTTNRLAEAEPLIRRALAIDEKGLGPEHPTVAIRLNNLALLLQATNRLAEAEPLMRRALAIDEKSFGPEHQRVAVDLNNLANLLAVTNRLGEAEPLMRRALAIDEKSLGPDHPTVAIDLNSLGEVLRVTNRLAEAEPLYRRALTIDEKSYGPDHPSVARDLNNLALLLQATNRLAEAEPLLRRTLAILGLVEHPKIAAALNNLAWLLQDTNRLAEAEPLLRRALAIDEKNLGSEHPDVARDLNNLAWQFAVRGDWAEAVAMGRRAKPILIARKTDQGSERTGIAKAALARNTLALRFHARAEHHADANNADAREEGFHLAQWALQTDAADALVQMSVRFAKGVGPLAALVRERQDLITRRQGELRRLDAAAGRAVAKAAEEARAALAGLDQQQDAINVRLAAEFKEYAELANPKALTIAATQALLNDGEALVLFLDVPQFRHLPGETLIWVVTKADARWARIDLASHALAERAAALRCGLDRGAWEGERKQRCLNLLGIDVEKAPDDGNPLPFDLNRAHHFYQALFGQVEDLIKGKHLLIVPSGPLTQVPFHVLVTEQPDPAATGTEAFRRAAWLAKRNAISVLPSVSSLKSLREYAKTSHAQKEFVGFGNPLLDGPDYRYGVRAEMARAKQQCPKAPWQRVAGPVAGGMKPLQQRGGLTEVADIRIQVPLPETADELCAVARDLGVPDSDILLGARASEGAIKRLSDSGELAAYRIIHFATHGALAGEFKGGTEPGLLFTPPSEATPEDDGYLSASEIAELKLDADWVILSACNTAAGGAEGAEALSGVSRAFFYAGARALLVSHWGVDSDATVKLITKTLGTMAADKTVGRAEALRRSMVALIERGEPHEAHPAYWAPFVLVGEGSAAGLAAKPLATPSIVPGPQPPSASRPRPSKRVTTPDWRTQIWLQ